jgi:bifunctional non-homologous end joining protein LigD
LVKAHGRGENGWLLMKLHDQYASDADILKKDKSVVSRKTIDQVAKRSTNIYGQTKKSKEKGIIDAVPLKKVLPEKIKVTKSKKAGEKMNNTDITGLLKKGVKN